MLLRLLARIQASRNRLARSTPGRAYSNIKCICHTDLFKLSCLQGPFFFFLIEKPNTCCFGRYKEEYASFDEEIGGSEWSVGSIS